MPQTPVHKLLPNICTTCFCFFSSSHQIPENPRIPQSHLILANRQIHKNSRILKSNQDPSSRHRFNLANQKPAPYLPETITHQVIQAKVRPTQVHLEVLRKVLAQKPTMPPVPVRNTTHVIRHVNNADNHVISHVTSHANNHANNHVIRHVNNHMISHVNKHMNSHVNKHVIIHANKHLSRESAHVSRANRAANAQTITLKRLRTKRVGLVPSPPRGRLAGERNFCES